MVRWRIILPLKVNPKKLQYHNGVDINITGLANKLKNRTQSTSTPSDSSLNRFPRLHLIPPKFPDILLEGSKFQPYDIVPIRTVRKLQVKSDRLVTYPTNRLTKLAHPWVRYRLLTANAVLKYKVG